MTIEFADLKFPVASLRASPRSAVVVRAIAQLAWTALLVLPVCAQTITLEAVSASGLWGSSGPANGINSTFTAISRDGRFDVFTASASDFVPGDLFLNPDVFLRDRTNGSIFCMSVSGAGVPANGASNIGDVSDDGRFVAYESWANNIVPNDTNAVEDVFLRDRTLGSSERISVGPGGVQANNHSFNARISGDGRYIVFDTAATNLIPGGSMASPLLRDRQLGTLELLATNAAGGPANGAGGNPDLSPDGRYVCFQHNGTDLVPGDINGHADIFLRDRVAGSTELISVSSGGVQADADGYQASISDDGRYVAWWSAATNLVPGDTNGQIDVFVRDRTLARTTRASVSALGVQGNQTSGSPQMSGDGRFVAFVSRASNFVTPDTNGKLDVFLRDLQLGTLRRLTDDPFGAESDGDSYMLSVNYDGHFIGFTSDATNLLDLDRNSSGDALLFDTQLSCPPLSSYCTAKTNSSGCTPAMTATGTPHASGAYDTFFLVAYYVRPSKPGVLVWSLSPTALPFGGGTLCVQSPVTREPVGAAGNAPTVGCDGTYSFRFGQAKMAAHGLLPGVTVYSQFVSRDPGFPPPGNVGLSDAIQFTICN